MKVITGKIQFEYLDQIEKLREKTWPDFIRVSFDKMKFYYSHFSEYQIALIDVKENRVIAIANSLPIKWSRPLEDLPDEGLDYIFQNIKTANTEDLNTLCGISMSIDPEYRKQGLSKFLIAQIKKMAKENNFKNLIFPIRPTQKSQHPEVEMSEYLLWQRPDGKPFDHWVRTHDSLGGEFIKVCHKSTKIQASLFQWSEWTGLNLEDDHSYRFEGGLNLLHTKDGLGTYFEPNLWIHYPLP